MIKIIFLLIVCFTVVDCDQCFEKMPNVTLLKYDSNLKPYYNLAVDFLHILHGSVPSSQIQSLINYFQNTTKVDVHSFWKVAQPIILDEVGYIILLAIGFAFMVLVPLVGLIFCCCRCCDNCGGKRYQKDPSCCCCSFLMVMVFVCFTLMLTGVAMYAVNNNEAYKNLDEITDTFLDQATDITSYLDATIDELICAMEREFNVVVTNAAAGLNAIATGTTQYILNVSGVTDLLNLQASLQAIVNDVASIRSSWSSVLDQCNVLNNSMTNFIANFTSIQPPPPQQYSINATAVSNELSFYISNNDYVQAIDVTFITDFLSQNNLTALSQPSYQYIESVTLPLSNAITPIVNSLTSVNSTVMDVAQNLQEAIDGVVADINDEVSRVNQSAHDVLQNGVYGTFSWVQYVSLILVLPVLIVCLLTFLGFCCGICGYSSKMKPYQRSGCSNCGGNTLICSVVMLFLFSWILMLICIVIFFFGYASETFVCQPIFEDSNINGLSLVPNLTINMGTGSAVVLSVQQSLLNCKNNSALYSAFGLQNAINLNQIFMPINQTIYNLSSINLSSLNFTATVVVGLPMTAFRDLQQQLKPLTGSLQTTATVFNTQPSYTIAIMANATNYLNTTNTTSSLLSDAININIKLKQLTNTLQNLSNVNQDALTQISNATDNLNNILRPTFNNPNFTETNTTNFLNANLNRVSNALLTFISALNKTVTEEVGKCKPVYDVFENTGVILCQQLLYPLQGWWLALGWCLLFFIPAICFNVRLAKYFRKMDPRYYQQFVPVDDRWSTDALELYQQPAKLPRINQVGNNKVTPQPRGVRRMY